MSRENTSSAQLKELSKVRDFRRKPEDGGRWSKVHFAAVKGTPWEPIPGSKSDELRTRVNLPTEKAPITPPVVSKDEYLPRRLRILKTDLEKYGFTAGCPGCRAVSRNLPHVAHAEDCRHPFEGKF